MQQRPLTLNRAQTFKLVEWKSKKNLYDTLLKSYIQTLNVFMLLKNIRNNGWP